MALPSNEEPGSSPIYSNDLVNECCSLISFSVFFFILMRAILPRFRYDQLMTLGWKCFLPLSLSYLIFTVSILISFNGLPY